MLPIPEHNDARSPGGAILARAVVYRKPLASSITYAPPPGVYAAGDVLLSAGRQQARDQQDARKRWRDPVRWNNGSPASATG